MKVTKKCMMTGEENTLDLKITEDQFRRWQNGELIQNAMPQLSPDEREFLISGIVPGKWDELIEDPE